MAENTEGQDFDITRDGELMVVQVEGVTDSAVEFLDGYMPAEGTEYHVVDSGRIIFPEDAMGDFFNAARQRGLAA